MKLIDLLVDVCLCKPCSVSSRAQLLQRPRALFLPLGLLYPHVLFVGHDVREHSSTEENHVPSPWRIFDADLEFLPPC